MIKFKKALIGTAAAGAMAVSATPAMANDYHGNHYKKDRIGAGEVIAGAVILGGLAAILASSKKKDRHYDRGYHGNRGYHGSRGHRGSGYDNGYSYKTSYRRGGGRKAVKRCIRRAERYAGGKVTEIRDIDRTRYGYKVKGRIVVKDGYRGSRYDRRASYDRGRFTCYVENGRIADIRYKGLNKRRYSYGY